MESVAAIPKYNLTEDQEKKLILREYRSLLRSLKPKLKLGDKELIRSAFEMAADAHKKMILDTRATDVFLTASIDGAPANWLAPSLVAAGIDLDVLRTTLPGKVVAAHENKKRWKDIYTAGHGVGNIEDIPTAAELCLRLIKQYGEAKHALTQAAA